MTKSIKLNDDNFFCDSVSKTRVNYRDDDSIEFRCKLPDKSVIYVPNSNIVNMSFKFQNQVYQIDVGQNERLTTCGYLIKGEYNHLRINDQDQGIKDRTALLQRIEDALSVLQTIWGDPNISVERKNNVISLKFSENESSYSFYFDTVSSIVTYNQERKMERLPFYPFDKGVDKYESIYLSVFADSDLDMFYVYRKIMDTVNQLIQILNSQESKDEDLWFMEIKPRNHFTRKI